MIRAQAVIRTWTWRRTVVFGLPGFWLATTVGWELVSPPVSDEGIAPRLIFCAVLLALVGCGLAGVRLGPVRELRQVRAVAYATQRVLLRPLPARIDGLAVAAGQLSASRGATVGGDLYEALGTAHGVRLVIGDVRGHGLAAIGAVAAVLGSFREAAHDEPDLTGVARRLERALQRHLRERARSEHPAAGAAEPDHPSAEEFVTVLLLEVDEDGAVSAINCGHPWPYKLKPYEPDPYEPEPHGLAPYRFGKVVEQLRGEEPLPPLGTFPLPAVLVAGHCTRLLPGETLVLHTDGATDARDSAGRFFPLDEALSRAARGSPAPSASAAPEITPASVISGVHRALLRHTGGRLTDDVALLVLSNDRSRAPGRPGVMCAARPATECRAVPAGRTAPGAGRRTVRGGADGPAAS
ncbi:PP2C family protein-serine/threonine phosphatase [Streptomyces sp. NPDC051322]|uniref:PP2C family protein-serine/threonine phosphatase n=1 Tax=Streptomyces sp. NPDC051322 TaxID=3154645 RepID=UPI00344D6005